MLRLVRFRQTDKENIDLDKKDLSSNNLIEAGMNLMQVANKTGYCCFFHYRIEDTIIKKPNGKPLVYYYADCTQYPIKFNYLLSDKFHFSTEISYESFGEYLLMRRKLINRHISPKRKVEVFDYVNKRYFYKEEGK